ncbi:MAG TPA: DUF6134 family protein [bacterium]|nr:DUF6134 family protein [bacterium]
MTSRYGSLFALLILASLVAASASADWWYAVYDGEKHVGYCHVVESSANLSGAVVKRFTAVTEARRDKAGQYTFMQTEDRYRSGGSLVYYASTVTDKDKTTQAKATRTAQGFSFAITKGEKVETLQVPAASFGMVEVEEALAKLAAPGSKIEVQALDLEAGKVRKTKLEYVADQTLEAKGESVATKVLQAKGGFGGATFWFAEDGSLVKREGETPLGKVTLKLTDAASARP